MTEYTVIWEGTWRPLSIVQSYNGEYRTAPTKTQQFTTNAPTKAAAYAYVTYYAEHCGMLDVKLITEGYNNEENQKPTTKSTAGKKAPRKKSRKKR